MMKIENKYQNENALVIDDIPISSTAPSDGQILVYDAASHQLAYTDPSSQAGGSSSAGPFSFEVINLTQTDDWNFYIGCTDPTFIFLGGEGSLFTPNSASPIVSIIQPFEQLKTAPQEILTYVINPSYTTRPSTSTEHWVLWFYKSPSLWAIKYKLDIWVTFISYNSTGGDPKKQCVFGALSIVPNT